MTVKIVTDSTCDLPPALAAELGITVVPVFINIGADSYAEGETLSRQEFYENLYRYPSYPTTAAPAAGTFTRVYEQLTAAGATHILSIHLASSLSNTFNAARLGADAARSAPVTLFDTQQITLGSGLLVLLAARAAAAGARIAEIMHMLRPRVPRTYVFGMIDTLESLRRSGRVNWTEFGIGSLLRIKPVMMIHSGQISVVDRVRTRQRSLQRLLAQVEALCPFEQLAVLHVRAPEAAAGLLARARHLFPAGDSPLITEITPAIGTHLGLGAVGFAGITAAG